MGVFGGTAGRAFGGGSGSPFGGEGGSAFGGGGSAFGGGFDMKQTIADSDNSTLGNLGRFAGRPGYAVNSLLMGDVEGALRNLGQMALDMPFAGFLNRNRSLANLFSDTGDLTSLSQRPEFSNVIGFQGDGLERFAVDVLGGMLTDPLTYMTFGGSAAAKGSLTGGTKAMQTLKIASAMKRLPKGVAMLTDDMARLAARDGDAFARGLQSVGGKADDVLKMSDDAMEAMYPGLTKSDRMQKVAEWGRDLEERAVELYVERLDPGAFLGFTSQNIEEVESMGRTLDEVLERMIGDGTMHADDALRFEIPFTSISSGPMVRDIWGKIGSYGTAPGWIMGAVKKIGGEGAHELLMEQGRVLKTGVIKRLFDSNYDHRVPAGLRHGAETIRTDAVGRVKKAAIKVMEIFDPAKFSDETMEIVGETVMESEDKINRLMAEQHDEISRQIHEELGFGELPDWAKIQLEEAELNVQRERHRALRQLYDEHYSAEPDGLIAYERLLEETNARYNEDLAAVRGRILRDGYDEQPIVREIEALRRRLDEDPELQLTEGEVAYARDWDEWEALGPEHDGFVSREDRARLTRDYEAETGRLLHEEHNARLAQREWREGLEAAHDAELHRQGRTQGARYVDDLLEQHLEDEYAAGRGFSREDVGEHFMGEHYAREMAEEANPERAELNRQGNFMQRMRDTIEGRHDDAERSLAREEFAMDGGPEGEAMLDDAWERLERSGKIEVMPERQAPGEIAHEDWANAMGLPFAQRYRLAQGPWDALRDRIETPINLNHMRDMLAEEHASARAVLDDRIQNFDYGAGEGASHLPARMALEEQLETEQMFLGGLREGQLGRGPRASVAELQRRLKDALSQHKRLSPEVEAELMEEVHQNLLERLGPENGADAWVAAQAYLGELNRMPEELATRKIWHHSTGRPLYVPHQVTQVIADVMQDPLVAMQIESSGLSLHDVFTKARKNPTIPDYRSAVVHELSKIGDGVVASRLEDLGYMVREQVGDLGGETVERLVVNPDSLIHEKNLRNLFLKREFSHAKTIERHDLWELGKSFGMVTKDLAHSQGGNYKTRTYITGLLKQTTTPDSAAYRFVSGGEWRIPVPDGWDLSQLSGFLGNRAKSFIGDKAKIVGGAGERKLVFHNRGINYPIKTLLTSFPLNFGFPNRNYIGMLTMAMFDPQMGPKVAAKIAMHYPFFAWSEAASKWLGAKDLGKFMRVVSGEIGDEALEGLPGGVGKWTWREALKHTRDQLGDVSETMADLRQIGESTVGFERTREAIESAETLVGLGGRLKQAWTKGGFYGGYDELIKFGEAASNLSERGGRTAGFLKLLEEGVDPVEAGKRVGDAFVNYRSNSAVESVLRSVVPFAKFQLGAMKWVKPVMQRPRLATPILRMRNAAQGQTPEGEILPEAVSDGVGIPLGRDGDGNMRYVHSIGLPLESTAQGLGMSPLGSFKGMRKGLAMLNPVAKFPLEGAANRDFHFGDEFGSYKKAPFFARPFANIRTTKDGRKIHEISGFWREVFDALPIQRQTAMVDRYVDENRPLWDAATQHFTGVRIRGVDADLELKRAIQTYMKDKVQEGQLAEFTQWVARGEPDGMPEDLKALLAAYGEMQKKNRGKK